MEPVEPLGPDARDLLATYRRERPGAHARARNWPGVRTRVDAPVRRAASPLWFGGLALVLAAAVLLLVHALFVAWQATQLERTTTPPSASDIVPEPPVDDVHVRAPSPVAVPPPVHAPTAVPAQARAIEPPPLQRPRVITPAKAETSEAPDPTAAELELVARARTAFNGGDLSTALDALEEHARRFPKGALAEERAAYRAIVLCRSGAANAPTARLEFESSYPRSHHHRAIEAACAACEDSPPP